jgi:hypothetical protein
MIPMAQKNVKVSELVHEKLESKKSADQTFDDVLREELGLTPDLDDMVAYFQEKQAKASRDLVSVIDDQGDFEWVTTETDHYQRLDFVSPESNLTIARADFTEVQMKVYYRNQHGDLDRIGILKADEDGEIYTHTGVRHEGTEELTNRVEKKVAGAFRKWG